MTPVTDPMTYPFSVVPVPSGIVRGCWLHRKKKQLCSKKSTLNLARCGSREKTGFMVTVWCTGLEQQEDEVVGQLPDYWMTCFRKFSDES